jgi:hypothetical protein
MKLGAIVDDQGKEQPLPVREGVWRFDEDDFLLAAMLQDPVYATELLWDDPTNREYAGCYRVRDYQFPLYRPEENYEGYACARSVGKTESIKARTFTHPFRRSSGEPMMLTAPELIHLLPLTDAVEARIRDTRLTREFLDTRGGKTGFTHRPFGVEFRDGTKIYGRIPRLTGTGVKGMHVVDLLIDEAQDYPEKGWIEVHETVMKDTVDAEGNPDFSYVFYGVHSGARDSGFFKRAAQGAFKMVQVTAMQRPGWGPKEKEAAKAAYGGTQAPDYRRNILGEPGSAASAFFVLSRLMACVDQNRDSDYNTIEYRHQELRWEEFQDMQLPVAEVIDLPGGYNRVWGGMDLGLNDSPTVITLWGEVNVKANGERRARARLKLFRRLTLQRFRVREIVETWVAIGAFYGPKALVGFGMDMTGIGLPIKQVMEDDQAAPDWLQEITAGYMFNAKVPVGVARENVSKDASGRLRDQFGSVVQLERDPLTGIERYVTYMPMIESSTRYLRDDVDSTYLLMPFDPEIVTDMQGETQQRVKRVGELRKKPNAFHILDSMRAMEQRRKAGEVEEQLHSRQVPVLDVA